MPTPTLKIEVYKGVLPTELIAMWEVAFAKHFTILWRSVLLNQIKAATPVESGRLRKSIYASARGGNLRIAARKQGFYWYMIDGLPERYLSVYNRIFPKIAALALQRANREVPLLG